ncbi:MAG: hypothetical protein ACD_74C00069G0003 [uncultured bacterium]|jgi:hypothetical protein|nr:MAG: hypothetical protein ACD_74C00069G0003 [uncultured bacterium]
MRKPPFVMSTYARREDLLADEVQYYKAECERLRAALEKIANVDYRGNRSQESIIAYKALHDA